MPPHLPVIHALELSTSCWHYQPCLTIFSLSHPSSPLSLSLSLSLSKALGFPHFVPSRFLFPKIKNVLSLINLYLSSSTKKAHLLNHTKVRWVFPQIFPLLLLLLLLFQYKESRNQSRCMILGTRNQEIHFGCLIVWVLYFNL